MILFPIDPCLQQMPCDDGTPFVGVLRLVHGLGK
jgi:hypothetical protein